LDEAHNIKNPEGSQSLAVQWLDADFAGLSTATPGINRISCWRGYLKFIRLTDRDIIPEEVLGQAASDPDFNPYLIDLRLDEEYANKFIFSNTNELEGGHYLGKLQELCCVRRIYSFIVNGEVLGKDIPVIISRQVKIRFSQKQTQEYKRTIEEAEAHFMIELADGRLAWNMKSFRTMILQSTIMKRAECN
jgi:hypothetical protein